MEINFILLKSQFKLNTYSFVRQYMALIKKFRVVPYLPEKLKPLMRIASNMWWVWNFEAIELFRRLDVELWNKVQQNPIKLLGAVSQRTLDEAARSDSFIAHMERVESELERHLNAKSWFLETGDESQDAKIAYFSAEFGIHECLPIYSGGLGVLAGDHLKSSSELGLPLYGVGLLYKMGYFRQYLNLDGWQQERFPETDFHNIPVKLVIDNNKEEILIEVEYPERNVFARIWEVRIGRIMLYLLDTNIQQNSPVDRAITDHLYGGDNETRVQQEIMLGIGGVRALKAMNKEVSVYHMNEGHAAFLALERIRLCMEEQNLTFNEALEFVSSSNVFTTHTPVPAGNDRFDVEMIDKYFGNYYGKIGLGKQDFMSLGRENPDDQKEPFCMTVLAIKTAASVNGVSKLHGSVSRRMWKNIWPYLQEHEIPIGHVTNGIQTLSWTSDEMMRLLNRYLGPRWIDNPANNSIWQNIDNIPDSELWRCRERLRERLVAFARKRLREQLIARGAPPRVVERANSVLDSEALTIGFARRFATYKRATLIFRDMSRLEKILLDRNRPVQIIFAGKAHPRDNMGKELIKQIVHLTNNERFRTRVVFIEDYDINIARYMVQGVDIWLNNPVRPKEASGTSGMKVIPNGGLNISVLDGWWDEAYNSNNGWAIGKGEEYEDHAYQDEVESLSLYNILENEAKPVFYDRGIDGLPNKWLATIRESMKSNNPRYNTNRQVKDYCERYYIKAHDNFVKFSDKDYKIARELSAWKKHVKSRWNTLSVKNMTFDERIETTVGSKVEVQASVDLGDIKPEEVDVELYIGDMHQSEEIIEGAAISMDFVEKLKDNTCVYKGHMLCLRSGQFGFTVRVIPYHPNMVRKFYPDLSITWA